MRKIDKLLEKMKSDMPDMEMLREAPVKLGRQYHYASLPLCIICAVFSIGSKYPAELIAVDNYCDTVEYERRGWERFCDDEESVSRDRQQSVSQMLEIFDAALDNIKSFEDISKELFCSTQRVSQPDDIFCAEAVYRFALALAQVRVEYIGDIGSCQLSYIRRHELERFIRQIPGQEDGVSLNYLYMLLGNEWHVKPDMPLLDYMLEAGFEIDRENPCEADRIFHRVYEKIGKDYPFATPRAIYQLIWCYKNGI